MKTNLILIVEDSNEIRITLEDLLRNENFPVLSARNGKQALQILENFPVLPDLIILDKDMPVLNGTDFLRVFRSSSKFSHIPVILMSEEMMDEEQALKSQLLFIKKPFKIKDLLLLIRSR